MLSRQRTTGRGRATTHWGDRVRAVLDAPAHTRILYLRRALAIVLVLVAAVFAAAPSSARASPPAHVVTAAHDLTAGTRLTASDLVLTSVPAELLPRGALTTVAAAAGRVLGGAVRSGEPLTDVRLARAAPAAPGAPPLGPGQAAVPVRLADSGVADLLHPGARVDVVTADQTAGTDAVLATDATVLTVRSQDPDGGQPGRLIVLALLQQDATRVAAVSLRQPVAVTLR